MGALLPANTKPIELPLEHCAAARLPVLGNTRIQKSDISGRTHTCICSPIRRSTYLRIPESPESSDASMIARLGQHALMTLRYFFFFLPSLSLVFRRCSCPFFFTNLGKVAPFAFVFFCLVTATAAAAAAVVVVVSSWSSSHNNGERICQWERVGAVDSLTNKWITANTVLITLSFIQSRFSRKRQMRRGKLECFRTAYDNPRSERWRCRSWHFSTRILHFFVLTVYDRQHHDAR